MQSSLSALHDMTGFTRETVKKRLDAAGLVATPGPHKSALYDTPQALAAIYQQPANNQNALMAARVKNLDLDSKLKAQKHAIAAGELISSNVVERVWGGMTGACRAHLLSLPYRLAVAAVAVDGAAAVEEAARKLIFEALENIHAYDPRDYLEEPGRAHDAT